MRHIPNIGHPYHELLKRTARASIENMDIVEVLRFLR